MGKIIKKRKNSGSDHCAGNEIWLFQEHTFGRDPRCSTVLEGEAVSRFHTRISWNGYEWTLRDLGSRNGTYINGRMKTSGECHRIRAGDRIHFGHLYEEYLLTEDDEPQSLLITHDAQKKETRIPLTHLLPLPSAERPLCTVFRDRGNDYHLENETGGVITLEHGNTISVDNVSYLVVFDSRPDEFPRTGSADLTPEQENIHLDIAVSPDEESAEIVVRKGNETHVLQPKTHFYLLAYLARIRKSQTRKKKSDRSVGAGGENGWIDCDVVCKELMINREHLAQQVFRIRQELKTFRPSLDEQIIDRRLRGKMRIGIAAENFEVKTMA